MPVQDAIQLIQKVFVDDAFRQQAYLCNNGDEFLFFLQRKGFRFLPEEFDLGASELLVQDREEIKAHDVLNIQKWYHYLRRC